MAKRKRTPEEQERRAKMTLSLQDLNVSSVEDVQNLFKALIGNVLENGWTLNGTRNSATRNCIKDTDNSRNGHSSKNLKTSFGKTIYIQEVDTPRSLRQMFGEYIKRYNCYRPHSSLNGKRPMEAYKPVSKERAA